MTARVRLSPAFPFECSTLHMSGSLKVCPWKASSSYMSLLRNGRNLMGNTITVCIPCH